MNHDNPWRIEEPTIVLENGKWIVYADGEALGDGFDAEEFPTQGSVKEVLRLMANAFDWGVDHGLEAKAEEIRESLGIRIERDPLVITGVERVG